MLGGVCMYEELKQIDPEVAEAIISELQRRKTTLNSSLPRILSLGR